MGGFVHPLRSFLLAKGIWTLGCWSLPPNPDSDPKEFLSWPITRCLPLSSQSLPYSPQNLPRRRSLSQAAQSRVQSTEALQRHSTQPPAISGSPARQGESQIPSNEPTYPGAATQLLLGAFPLLFLCPDLSIAVILEDSVPLTSMRQHVLVLPNPSDMSGFCPSFLFPKHHTLSSHLMVLPWEFHNPV